MDDRRIILVAAALLLPGIVFVAFTTAGFLGYLIPESKLCGLPLTSEIIPFCTSTTSTSTSTTSTSTSTTTSSTTSTSTSTTTSSTTSTSTSTTTSSTVSYPDSCFNHRLDLGELEVDCGGLCRSCFIAGGGFNFSNPLIWNESFDDEVILSCTGSDSLEKVLFYTNRTGQLGVQGSIYSYNLVSDSLRGVELGSRGVLGAEISADGEVVYALVRDRRDYKLFIFENNLRKRELVFDTDNSSLAECLSVSGDGSDYSTEESFLSVDGSTVLDIYNANGKGVVREDDMIYLFDGRLNDFAVSGCGDFLVASVSKPLISKSKGNELFFFYVGSGLNESEEIWVKEFPEPVQSVALSLDDGFLAAGLADNRVCLFDLEGKELFCYRTNWSVQSVDVSIDGEYVAALSGDRHLYVLNKSGVLLWSYQVGSPVDMVLSDDGRYLLACSDTRVYLFKGPAFQES